MRVRRKAQLTARSPLCDAPPPPSPTPLPPPLPPVADTSHVTNLLRYDTDAFLSPHSTTKALPHDVRVVL